MNISEVILPQPHGMHFRLSFTAAYCLSLSVAVHTSVLIQKKQKIKAVKRELKSIRIAKIF